nr:MAG: polyprotein [Picornaviridae sp.]
MGALPPETVKNHESIARPFFLLFFFSTSWLTMENLKGVIDSPLAEAMTPAVAVADAITSIPEHLTGKVDATTTDVGTAVHQGSHNAISVTAKPSEMNETENAATHTTDDFYSCAYEFGNEAENIGKMILLDNGEWNTSHTNGKIIGVVALPYKFFSDANRPAYGQTKYFAYLRTGYHFQLMVSAPVGYAGALAAVYVPYQLAGRIGNRNEEFSRYGLDFSTFANLPHTILNVSDNTEASLTVPYISSKNYIDITKDRYPPEGGLLVIVVLAELEAPTGSNNTIGYSIYGSMLDMDLQCPRIYGDQGRLRLKKATVTLPPPPKIPEHTIIQPGPGAWNSANSIIAGDAESMAIANEATAVDFTTAGAQSAEVDLVDVLKRWSLVKTVQWNGSSVHGSLITNFEMNFDWGNFAQICRHFHYFRGSLEFKIAIYAPKSSQGRIQLSWFPTRTASFSLAEARNSIYVVTDVGGPAPVLVCPFTSPTWRRDFSVYGHICAHVINVFRSNNAAANQCTLQIWVRAGADFALYCPRRPSTNFDIPSVGDQPGEPKFLCEQGVTEPMENATEPNIFLNFERVQVDVEGRSHSNLRYLFGRPWFVAEYGPNLAATRVALQLPDTGVPGLAHAYMYWSGEFNITIQTGRDPAIFTHSYQDLGGTLPLEDLMSNGAVFVPRYTFKTLKVPFYSVTPLRYTYQKSGLGYVYINAPNKVYLYLSMPKANFFQKIPLPKVATRAAVLGTYFNPRSNARCLMYDQGKPKIESLYPDSNSDKFGYSFRHLRDGTIFGHRRGDHYVIHCERSLSCLHRISVREWFTIKKMPKHKDVALCGDVELNPGPQLVYRDRGLYKHYGVRCGQTVFHTATENLARSLVTGEVAVIETPYDSSWIPVGKETTTMAEQYLKKGLLPNFRYNIDSNCESWARDMLSGDATSYQGSYLKWAMAMTVAMGFFMSVVNYENQAGMFSSVTNFLAKVTHLIYGGFECFVVKTVVKTVIKIICYLIMYAHCPNLLTTGVLATLLAIDCMNAELDATTRKLVDALVEGKFTAVARALLNVAQIDDEPPNFDGARLEMMTEQGPRDFNDWSNVAKNVKWWFENLTSCFQWIKDKIFPPDLTESIDELEEHRDRIACVFALCDEHLCEMMTNKDYSTRHTTKEKHKQLTDMLSGILDFLSNLPKTTPLFSRAQSLMHRMQQMTFEPSTDWAVRPEPVGVWISGTAGVGKSFLVQRLVAALSKHFGWKAYNNPTGSNHMDGYTDQEIHIFDDFGQCRDEDDYSLICQLISTCPFIVPKADVSAKGTLYQARCVIITTNRHNFSSHKLYDPDALRRRFPILLQIRPKQECAVNDRLDVSAAMRSGALIDGSCWQKNNKFGFHLSINEDWVDMDLDVLVKELIDEIETRARIVRLMNQGKDDDDQPWYKRVATTLTKGQKKLEKVVTRKIKRDLFVTLEEPESFFDCEKISRTVRAAAINLPNQSKWNKCKFMVQECINKLKAYLDEHKTWIMAIGALGSVISVASIVIPWTRSSREESHYDGNAPVRLTRDFVKAAEKHVASVVPRMTNQGKMNFDIIARRLVEVSDSEGFSATALPIGPKEVITYGHDSFCFMTVGGEKRPIVKAWDVTINGDPMDLQILCVDSGMQFKKISHLIYDMDYEGNGFLLWRRGDQIYVQPVSNISSFTHFSTMNGTLSTYCYVYEATTTIGSCGGVLVAPVGGNLKVLGIHVAGNGTNAVACRLFKFYSEQGKITSMVTYEKPLYHQPRKTAFRPSPFMGPNPALEPAVLRRTDPRLEIDLEDITIHAAHKYRGNTFDPPPACFAAAISEVTRMLRKVVRKSSSVTYDVATSSELMPIDWTTSPGHKYHGVSKHQLIEDPLYNQKFHSDVMEQLVNPGTYFTTYLKDELRPIAKVKVGKTRAIEACNFDYVIAYRMVMGKIYNQIYDDKACVSGVGVGICPYLHWGSMMKMHYQNALCLDFSGFDGSLPPQLLEAGVEVLAQFHDNPRLVRRLHQTVINSEHLVSNQRWTVEGGMCSGAPCTSVLNSICNNIAAVCVALSCGAQLGSFHLVSYGDDILFTSKEKFDTTNIQHYYKIFFGMDATAADKTDSIGWEDLSTATFLKRKTGFVDFYPFPVGILDLQSMMDHIEWTKGSFAQQLESFCFELVLHGEKTYLAVQDHLLKISPKVNFPSYFEMRNRVKALMMNQGKPPGFGAEHAHLAADVAAQNQSHVTYGDHADAVAINLYQLKVLGYGEPSQLDMDFVQMSEFVTDQERAGENSEFFQLVNEVAHKEISPSLENPVGHFQKVHMATCAETQEEHFQEIVEIFKSNLNNLDDFDVGWMIYHKIEEHIDLYSQGDLFYDNIYADAEDAAWAQVAQQ